MGRTRNEFVVKRSLKRSKLFQIQKLTKSIRLLNCKKGSEAQVEKYRRKGERLSKELEILKDTKITELTKQLLPHNEDDSIRQLIHSNELPADITERAKWRILHCKNVKDVIPVVTDMECDTKTERNATPKNEELNNSDTVLMDEEQEQSAAGKIIEKSTNRKREKTKRFQKEFDNTNSVFIGSLSNSQSSKHSKKSSTIKYHKPKNRMGQRQRRIMWESMYGAKARHLRNEHGRRKEKFHPMKKAQSSSDKNETLHPSWEASRQRKAQEKFEQSNIKGEHIVFNDSD